MSNPTVWNILAILDRWVRASKDRKLLSQTENANAIRRGLTEYNPCPIEALFQDDKPKGNIIFSGSDYQMRSRAIVRAAELANSNGKIVIIFHVNNSYLEQELIRNLGLSRLTIINENNPYYDPFVGLTNLEISSMILESAPSGMPIPPAGRHYLDGILNFIRLQNVRPSVLHLLNCNHFRLIDKVNDAVQKNSLLPLAGNKIISQLMQGDPARSSIENYFIQFGYQASKVVARNTITGINFTSLANSGCVIVFDIISCSNNILLNLLFAEVKRLTSLSYQLFVVIDSIPFSSSDMMQQFEANSGTDYQIFLSADDAYSSFRSPEDRFFSFVGRSSQILISKHISNYSAQKWSDVIGSYDKEETSKTLSSGTSFLGGYFTGGSTSISISQKRENIVKPETILQMGINEVYFRDVSLQGVGHTYLH